MTKYDPPAPDSLWLKNLRDVLEDDEHWDPVTKLEIIYEMMPDDPHTYTPKEQQS